MAITPKQLQWLWQWTVDHHHPRRHPLLMQLQLHSILCSPPRCYHPSVQQVHHPRLRRRLPLRPSNLPTWPTANITSECILPIFKIQTRLGPFVSRKKIDLIFFISAFFVCVYIVLIRFYSKLVPRLFLCWICFILHSLIHSSHRICLKLCSLLCPFPAKERKTRLDCYHP